MYFDQLLTKNCVSTCPSTTFASNGLCMACPSDCQTCQLDGIFRSYLECKVCSTGFSLQSGQCYKSCSPGLGYSIVSNTCQQCSDPNCLNCSNNVNNCTTCNLLYIASAGACIRIYFIT
jgi:hypothetical protein